MKLPLKFDHSSYRTDILDANNEIIAIIFFKHDKEHAEIILRTVNCHDELVENLACSKKLQRLTLDNELRWMRKHEELCILNDQLVAALRKLLAAVRTEPSMQNRERYDSIGAEVLSAIAKAEGRA